MALQQKSKSSLFLIELIIVILMFAIASAICVSLFVQARLMSLQSTQLTMSVNRCQSAAECIRAVGDDPKAMEELLGAVRTPEGGYRVYYNKDWELSQEAEARYILSIDMAMSRSDGLLRSSVVMTEEGSEGEPIYTLETTQFEGTGETGR